MENINGKYNKTMKKIFRNIKTLPHMTKDIYDYC